MVYRPLAKANTEQGHLPKGASVDNLLAKSAKTDSLKTRAALLLSQALFQGLGQNATYHLSKSHWDAIQKSGLLTPDALIALQKLQENPEALKSDDENFIARCALRFQFAMPEEPSSAVAAIEQAVLDLTGASRCELFTYDENTGIYSGLSGLRRLDARARELTVISDDYLCEWLEVSKYPKSTVAHQHLVMNNELLSLVAIRYDAQASDASQILETLTPFLTLKLLQFMQIKRGLFMPHKQQVLTELSNRLVSAVDKESIITETLDVLWSHLGFGACQYVVLSSALADGTASAPDVRSAMANAHKNGNDQGNALKFRDEGVVLYENINGRLKSFFHAGLVSKRHVVKDFASIVSLLSSGWRKHNYLHLSGGQLGEKSLSSIFGVRQLHAALILPIVDVQTGKINATLNVFQTKPVEISNETIDLLMTVMELVANALGRATVLEKALAMATRDELTALLNRRGFYERFQAEIDRARRHPGNLCVALIDVDHFKKLNDTYGHLSGDKALQALADSLNASLRRTDIVSRFGGEEFAVLLPDASVETAYELLERVRKTIAKVPIAGANGETLKISVSMGVSAVEQPAGDMPAQHLISQALAKADMALYDAKAKGRNRVCKSA